MTDSLPAFEFESGYTLRCADYCDDGVKVTLGHEREQGGSIILPPEQCVRLERWLKSRIGERVTHPRPHKPEEKRFERIANPSRFVSKKTARELQVMEKVEAFVDTFCDIIENDTGVTADEIKNYKCKRRLIVFARDVLALVLRNRYELSMPVIAGIVGAKCHASVWLSLKKFDQGGMSKKLYKGMKLLGIYKDAKRRYKKPVVFERK